MDRGFSLVMAGLVPAIPIVEHWALLTEIAGTSPAMTPQCDASRWSDEFAARGVQRQCGGVRHIATRDPARQRQPSDCIATDARAMAPVYALAADHQLPGGGQQHGREIAISAA